MPPAFDQQAFMEAIGAATATIAQASAMVATIAHAGTTAGQERGGGGGGGGGGQVTSKGLRHTILQHSWEEGTR